MNQRNTSVLIVGAGPCGMIAALALQRSGVKAIIVDKRPTTRQYSQAVVLWSRTLEILDLLGIAERWRSKSIPAHQFSVNFGGHMGMLKIPAIESPYPHPWCVGQDVTEAILQERLLELDIELIRPAEALSVEQIEGGYRTVIQEDGGTVYCIESDWIIGAEGSSSIVRKAAGINRTGDRNAGVQLVQGDVRLGGDITLGPGQGFLLSDTQGTTILIIPASVDGYYRVLATVADDGEKEAPSLEYLQSFVDKFMPSVKLHDPIWLNRFRTQHQIADTYRKGRAFVVGDAAHVWVPIGGQGMNIGMQDAFDLGWKLAEVIHQTLPESILDTHTSERRPIGSFTISYTETSYKAILEHSKFRSLIQKYILPNVLDVSVLDDVIAKHLGQTSFRYPESPLVRNADGHGSVKAGERAPDTWVNYKNETIRLFDLFRNGRWTLFGWSFNERERLLVESSLGSLPSTAEKYVIDCSPASSHAASEHNTLRDIPRLAARAYGVGSAGFHLVRPDGVVAYSGSLKNQTLGEFLASLG